MYSNTSLWRNLCIRYLKTIKNGEEFHVCCNRSWAETGRDILRWTANETTKNSSVFICCRHSIMFFGLSMIPRALLRFVFVGIRDFSCKDSWHGLVVIPLGNRLSSVFVEIARKFHTHDNPRSGLMCLNPTQMLGILTVIAGVLSLIKSPGNF